MRGAPTALETIVTGSGSTLGSTRTRDGVGGAVAKSRGTLVVEGDRFRQLGASRTVERRQQRLAGPSDAKGLEYLVGRNLSRIT